MICNFIRCYNVCLKLFPDILSACKSTSKTVCMFLCNVAVNADQFYRKLQ
jgi:hypothetical protein